MADPAWIPLSGKPAGIGNRNQMSIYTEQFLLVAIVEAQLFGGVKNHIRREEIPDIRTDAELSKNINYHLDLPERE